MKLYTVLGPGPGNGTRQLANSHEEAYAKHYADEYTRRDSEEWKKAYQKCLDYTKVKCGKKDDKFDIHLWLLDILV